MEAVKGLSFSVAPGEIVGFLGPNGAGKSSTLKAIMGFVTPLSGKCQVFGAPVGTVESRRQIGYLPEVALYYPYLTPLETLTLYGQLQGLSGASLKKEANDLLESVGVAASARKQNRTLSKGMLQRVGIAQSLLGDPRLLVLDEVTSGLDPVGRQELRKILKARREQGVTLFFSSHELAEVDMLCDRILLINLGKLVEEREMTELKDHLRQFLLTYTGDVSMTGLTENWRESAPGHRTAQFTKKAHLVEAIQRVVNAKGHVLDVVAQEGSLEDYFIEAIGGVR